MSPAEFAERASITRVVDTRMPQAFAGGHMPGSYNLWFGGLSSYLGWIVPPGESVLFVLPRHADMEEATRTALRLGYDELAGYLRGGFEAWQNDGREIATHGTMDTAQLTRRMERGEELYILDVRNPDEVEGGTVPGARTIFVGELENKLDEVPDNATLVSMCSVGHRGGLGASILKRHGFTRVYNYLGGYTAWQKRA